MTENPKLILASKSAARIAMLKNAGLMFGTNPANINETDIIKKLNAENPKNIALELARQKALAISQDNPNAYVIGSDQVLECDGQVFEKSKTKEEAKERLKTFRNKTHRLISAVAIAQENKIVWEACETAELTMRDCDDAFLEDYIEKAGEDLLSCVGGYALEKSGIWLFSDIKGDYFTILGMPLLQLLGYLKNQGFKP